MVEARMDRGDDEGSTHWEGCYKVHPACALARIVELESQVKAWRDMANKWQALAQSALGNMTRIVKDMQEKLREEVKLEI
jgi:hypothetical protein